MMMAAMAAAVSATSALRLVSGGGDLSGTGGGGKIATGLGGGAAASAGMAARETGASNPPAGAIAAGTDDVPVGAFEKPNE
jgi:hypothetical protein